MCQQLLEWVMREAFEEQHAPDLTASADPPPQLPSTHLELQYLTYPYFIAAFFPCGSMGQNQEVRWETEARSRRAHGLGRAYVWEEESVFGIGEVQLAIKEPRRKRGKGSCRKGPAFDAWKGDVLEDVEDGYESDQWGSRKPRPKYRERDSEVVTGLNDLLLDGKVSGKNQLEFK
ncbi:uncharacterized protein BJ212DRAFT_1301532 [Suillus subaureus]|uniref:Uncharacterized protein n=1 Tax=Suillus subaureus TaxID=48587 RepID=A0A9P7JBC6_9AGAM|nr:uncharacterized protein BJ212DRAFT_1301532 [Suillus subaureus]KAG1812558.1 hypothetical protein BJ212DRAFT_1301532 [Suillus subaureus]